MPSACNFLHCCSSAFSLFASLIFTPLRHLWTPFHRSCPSLIYLHFPFHSLVPIYAAVSCPARLLLHPHLSISLFVPLWRPSLSFPMLLSSAYPISFPFSLFLSIPNFLVTLRFRYLPSSPNSFIPREICHSQIFDKPESFNALIPPSLMFQTALCNWFYCCLRVCFFFLFIIFIFFNL